MRFCYRVATYAEEDLMIDKTFMLDLQLFAGEGGDGAGEGGNDAGVNTEQGAAVPAPRRARRENPLANVKFGIQPEDNAGQAAAGTTEEAAQQPAEESFEQLIGKGGKHEKAFSDAVSKIVQKRVGDTKKLEGDNAQLREFARLVASRYNVEIPEDADVDIEAIKRAVYDDDRYWEKREIEENRPRSQLQSEERTAEAQRQLNMERREFENQLRAQQMRARHLQEAEALKAKIPEFDLDAEMSNRVFAGMIFSGFPLENAYYAVHHEDIMRQQQAQYARYAQQAVQQTKQMTASAIASGTARPAENGSGAAAGAVHITDPGQLTREQRAEIRRRVNAGEKIVW